MIIIIITIIIMITIIIIILVINNNNGDFYRVSTAVSSSTLHNSCVHKFKKIIKRPSFLTEG